MEVYNDKFGELDVNPPSTEVDNQDGKSRPSDLLMCYPNILGLLEMLKIASHLEGTPLYWKTI